MLNVRAQWNMTCHMIAPLLVLYVKVALRGLAPSTHIIRCMQCMEMESRREKRGKLRGRSHYKT